MMKRLRKMARHCVLNGFAAIEALQNREEQIAASNIVQVVNFHHLYQYEEESFRAFLEWFGEHYEVISYSEAAERVRNGNIDKAYGAITFDDGLKSVVSAGKILSDFGFSATFFVCSGIIGETNPTKLRAFCEDALMVYESDEFLSWDDLETLLKQGQEIGCHTISHPKLSEISQEQLYEEIYSSRELLTQKLGVIEHFAWPFGSFELLGNSAAEKLADAGYASIGSGKRGSHGPHAADLESLPPVCLRRDNFEARWPLGHIKHFLINNVNDPVGPRSWWPQDWNIASQRSPSN